MEKYLSVFPLEHPYRVVTYLLTPRSRGLPEKLTRHQLVTKFPAFYWTRRFITAFTTARRPSLPWARSIQSIPPSHFSKIHFNINLPSPIHATCPSHLSLLCLALSFYIRSLPPWNLCPKSGCLHRTFPYPHSGQFRASVWRWTWLLLT